MNRFQRYLLSIVLTIVWVQAPSFAQLISSEFGQNRIQHEKYKWNRYESPHFAYSYTEENENMMRFLVPLAESNYQELKAVLEYNVRNKIELIVYSDFSDFAQSNVGLQSHMVNTAGVTHLLDNKILIYFDGSHQNLQRQLRQGITRALLNRMLFGSNLQEMVQNSVLLHLPEWFTEGLVAYAVEEWNTEVDDELREALFSGKYANFVELAQKEPRLAGHSLFHYVARNHGKASVSNLLYLTRINRSVESGFLYVFGSSFYTIVGTNWFNFYSKRYNQDNEGRLFPNKGELDLSTPRKNKIQHMALSPNGKHLAFVERYMGEYKVVVYDFEKEAQEVVIKGGMKDHTSDVEESYPLLAWRKNSNELIVIQEKNDKPLLSTVKIGDKKTKVESHVIKGLERVLSVDVLAGNDLLLTGLDKGYSDIYLYKSGSAQPLVNDVWDDLYARAITLKGRKGIIFASNRPEALLKHPKSADQPLGKLDLFFYDLESKSNELIRLTHTPLNDERQPEAIDSDNFSYLSSENGIWNRYIGTIDSVVDYYQQMVIFKDGRTELLPKDSTLAAETEGVDSSYLMPVYKIKASAYANTNYSRNILEHSIVAGNKVADLFYRDGRYRIFVRDLVIERSADPAKTQFRLLWEKMNGVAVAPDPTQKDKKANSKKDKKEPISKEADDQLKKELEKVEQELGKDSTKTNLSDSMPPNAVKKNNDTSKVDIDNYLFQSEFEEVKEPKPKADKNPPAPIVLIEGQNGEIKEVKLDSAAPVVAKNSPKAIEFDPAKSMKYKSLFRVDELTFQVDNTPLFWGMQMYLQGPYRFPTLGLLFKTAFTDIFENYRLEVGARLPVNFNGMEYFITLDDRKNRLDKKFTLYRRGRLDDYLLIDSITNEEFRLKGRTIKHLAMAEFRYPLSKFQSLRATVGFHADKVAIVANDQTSLRVPVLNESRFGLRFEYVFDNTVDLGLNAKKGTRYRLFADVFQPAAIRTDSVFRLDLSGGSTFVLGADARHYISFDNKTVFAFRATGATSMGKQKMLYSMGGMENWIFPSTNPTIPLPENSDAFAYQVLAANMRGFQSNIRNGSSFALISGEMRVPIASYLSRTPPRNVFLSNMQLITFYDVGTAWHGLSPFSKDNPLNTSVIDPGASGSTVSPIRVRVNYYRHPIVQGYGFGLRTIFLGYFVRMDYAWGIETGTVQNARVYLSLGKDF